MLMKKLILFDIDGTLVAGAFGHAEAFAIAFKEIYGVNASIYMINPNGMTDQEIILAVMKKVGIAEEVIEERIQDCMEVMVQYFKSIQPMLTIKLLPGVKEFLETLRSRDYLMGLVTGNLEPIGRAKMEIAGLGDYFSVGGFGSDSRNRSELVKRAIDKAESEYEFELDDNVYLFGDAPQDIRAALVGGAQPIGVTTGIYSSEDLVAAGATVTVPGLTNIGQILSLLGS